MDYLSIREQYRIAYGRWERCANQLCELLGCDFANLETALLYASPHQRRQSLVDEYTKLGLELDRASDKWDTAQALQARFTAGIRT